MNFLLALLRLLPPEVAHQWSLSLLPLWRGEDIKGGQHGDQRTVQRLWGMDFFNPFGLAAGFDKNAERVGAIMKLGFGFLEVGTVTPKPQRGNPKPRVFRLGRERAIINRMGFPSKGREAVKQNLHQALMVEWVQYKNQKDSEWAMSDDADAIADEKKKSLRDKNRQKYWQAEEKKLMTGDGSWLWSKPLLVNIGPNRDSINPVKDFAVVAKYLSQYASAFVINISSPNTAGLRALQSPDSTARIIDGVRKVSQKPLLVKFSPDLARGDLEELAKFCLEKKIDGAVLTNTTVSRFGVEKSRHHRQAGGLSGSPLLTPATRALSQFYLASMGQIPLIGVGGVMSGEDAVAKIMAGASLVECYTGLVYRGPRLWQEAMAVLSRALPDRDDRIKSLVGKEAEEYARL